MRTITPRNRAAWRRWLEANHDTRTEVWLVFYKAHTNKANLSYGDAVEEAICFGWIDGVKKSLDDARYTHRFSPRTASSQWSATNRKRAEKMLRGGHVTRAGRQAIDRAKRSGTWNPKAAPVDTSVPRELSERLDGHPEAKKFFDSLAPTYRAQFTGWINAAKRDDTKQRRLREAMKLLANGQRLGMR